MNSEVGRDKNLLRQSINMAPTKVELELTEQCNLSCVFCYNSQKPIISGLSERILQRLIEEGVLEIVLTGGEPMLHPKFSEILKFCTDNFVRVMIQTNGTLISKEWARLFSRLGVFGINISLHGLEDVHEGLTQVNGSFQKALDGIRNVIYADKNIRLASNCVLTKKNFKFVNEQVNFLYDVGVREFTFTRFTPTGVGESSRTLLLSRDELNETLEFLVQKFKSLENAKFILANSMPMCGLKKNLEFLCECCNFGISKFYVNVQGDVLLCGMSRLVIGNILQQTFRDMKSSTAIYKNRVLGLDLPNECRQCLNFQKCRGGCRAAAVAYFGRLNAPDPYATMASLY